MWFIGKDFLLQFILNDTYSLFLKPILSDYVIFEPYRSYKDSADPIKCNSINKFINSVNKSVWTELTNITNFIPYFPFGKKRRKKNKYICRKYKNNIIGFTKFHQPANYLKYARYTFNISSTAQLT